MGTFVGVDVGTGSVRAALFAGDGRLLASSTQEIAMWSPRPDFYQQDSEAVWQACCLCVRVSPALFSAAFDFISVREQDNLKKGMRGAVSFGA